VGYRVATVDELQDIAYRQGTHMRPVRHHMGISAFGTNAWTAANVGDRLMPEHREDPGIEELYAVLRGRARFEIDGETVDAPVGTLVFVGPEVNRTAFAEEAGEERYEHAAEMAAHLMDMLEGSGCEVVTEPGQATLVTWKAAGDSKEVVERLADAGVVIRDLPGLGWLRASCGFWTNHDDLERLVGAL